MRTKIVIALVISLISLTSKAQMTMDKSVIKEEMAKLSFITGNWSGSGWNMGRDREKQEFNQTEKISYKLDGTIILIEGLGKSEGEIVHDALAIISYDTESKTYIFKSYLSDGRVGEFKAFIEGGEFVWELNENMRYKIVINERGQWVEKGEYNNNGSWFQIFEMTLDKTDN